MAIVPFRDLASRGVLHDPADFQLPLNAWTGASNVRFHANSAERAPVFRAVIDPLPCQQMSYAFELRSSTGINQVFLVNPQGRIWKVQDLTVTEVTSGGTVTSFTVTNAGSDYPAAPAVTVAPPSDPFAAVATAHAVLDTHGHVSSIVIDSPGGGYTGNPTVSIAAVPVSPAPTASANTAPAGSDRTVSTITLNANTTVYSVAPAVTLTGSSYANNATAHTTLDAAGHVNAVVVDTIGLYKTADTITVTIADPPRVQATATATVAAPITRSATANAFTSAVLADVVYVNRPDAVPQYYASATSSFFAPLPNWDAAWRCRSLRAFGDYLVALNVTKGPTVVPSMVKWSTLTLAGQVPGSWDATDPTTNAGENVLEDLRTPIVDGLALRDKFAIYSSDQVVLMEATTGQAVFAFRTIFNDGGMIAPNCVAEANGKHYVFGPNDIYVHDGTQKQSLVDGRNRRYIFEGLDRDHLESCFVKYLPAFGCVLFAYPSGKSDAAFLGGGQCNRAAVYDLVSDAWGFIDLPNVCNFAITTFNETLTYSTAGTTTYGTIGGSYFDQTQSHPERAVAASAPIAGVITAPRLLGYDFVTRGSMPGAYLDEVNGPAVLERTGIDMEQIGADVPTVKLVRRLFPLVTTASGVPVQIQVGSSMEASGPYTWTAPASFDPRTQYKIDLRRAGRFLGVRFFTATPGDFEVAGFDVDIVPNGTR